MGDIHGDAVVLKQALVQCPKLVDELVLVGDYVDRGPDSKGVVELLLEAKVAWGERMTLLRGNHEEVLLRFLKGDTASEFLRHEGLSTVRSYLGAELGDSPLNEFRRTFPTRHLSFLESLQSHYETEDILVSHVGFNPANPAGRSLDEMVMGSYPELFRAIPFTKLVVCGHYVQRTGLAYSSDTFVCLDSGCGTYKNGPLSLLTLPDRTIHKFRSASE